MPASFQSPTQQPGQLELSEGASMLRITQRKSLGVGPAKISDWGVGLGDVCGLEDTGRETRARLNPGPHLIQGQTHPSSDPKHLSGSVRLLPAISLQSGLYLSTDRTKTKSWQTGEDEPGEEGQSKHTWQKASATDPCQSLG